MEDYPIVVGYDGSASAREALRWALDEAAGRSAPLRLVYVVDLPVTAVSLFPMPSKYSAEAFPGSVSHFLLHHARCSVAVIPR